jgi:hypothetical protein
VDRKLKDGIVKRTANMESDADGIKALREEIREGILILLVRALFLKNAG